MSKKPLKVLLVEDHDIVRHGIKALLEDEPAVQVVAEAANGMEALDQIARYHPEVVLMDMNMPVMNGLECTQKIKLIFPHVKILILSMHDHESYLINLLEAGANGYILKNTSREELIFAIRKIGNDGMYMGPEFTMNMLAKYKAASGFIGNPVKTNIAITDRERDVLNLIAEGLTNTEMAQKLFTSVRTIETRRKNLLTKTGTTNTATLIKFAVKNGMIK
ncbi:MAG: DNA-binding response regulator [Bacteroidetes bacterium]|nr:DNA-binding response regulator [Bacteroidota bacterium]